MAGDHARGGRGRRPDRDSIAGQGARCPSAGANACTDHGSGSGRAVGAAGGAQSQGGAGGLPPDGLIGNAGPEHRTAPTDADDSGAAASSPLEFAHMIRHDDGAVRPAAASGAHAAVRGRQDALSARLQPTGLSGVSATRLPDSELTIAQGTIIPCIQQTALDSSYPGLITAVIPQDIYSAGGHTVLIDAGSKVVGTMQKGIVRRPLARIRALAADHDARAEFRPHRTRQSGRRCAWPHRSGRPGEPAFLGEDQGRAAALDRGYRHPGGGTRRHERACRPQRRVRRQQRQLLSVPEFGRSGCCTLLQSTISIPDTLTRPQGASCSIFVARDLISRVSTRYASGASR